MKATNLARVVDRLIVVDHAIARHLQYEGATQDQIRTVLFGGVRQDAADFLAEELARALPMSPAARRIFIHPEREGKIGKRRGLAFIDREGRRRKTTQSKKRDSQYFWTGYAVFILEHNILMTVYVPTMNQFESLAVVMPEVMDTLRGVPDLLGYCGRRLRATNATRLKRESGICRIPARKENWRREMPPMPRWKRKDGAAWNVIIIPEGVERDELRTLVQEIRQMGEGSEVLFEMTDEFSRKLAVRLEGRKATVRNGQPDDEPPSSRDQRQALRIRRLPALPSVDWSSVDEAIPTSARRWWSEVLKAGENAGQITTLVTPSTAKAILEIADGSSNAQWRKSFREGSVGKVRISLSGPKVVLSYT